MSVITRLLHKVFGRQQARVLLLGIGGSGRTTALYQMKLGECVQTIPTIGFNVESIIHQEVELTVWDVGGRDKIRALWRHYYQNTQGIIFVVDSSQPEYFEECRDELERALNEDELRDCVLLVFANKQDLANALSPDEVAAQLRLPELRRRRWHIQGCCSTTGEGLVEGFDWLVAQLTGKKPPAEAGPVQRACAEVLGRAMDGWSSLTDTPAKVLNDGTHAASSETAARAANAAAAGSAPESPELQLLSWLEREEGDEEQLLADLAAGNCSSWDHFTCLRSAWLLLRRYGRREAIRLLFAAARAAQGLSFHETMLYFWVHMVHYASEATRNPMNDFKGFLLLNPQLTNTDLPLNYYSRKVLFEDELPRTSVVPPDKKPLPSLLSPVASLKVGPAESHLQPATAVDDEAFLQLFQARSLPSYGHEQRLRAVWALARRHGRRGGGTTRVLEALQAAEGAVHNVTEAYFWLQMVTLATSGPAGEATSWSAFVARPEGAKLLDSRLIFQHYSAESLSRGAQEFCLPDKRPLPSVA